MVDEVFILDLTRQDGTRFVTSVSTAGDVLVTKLRHRSIAGQVSHWKRDQRSRFMDDLLRDWRLHERFNL